MLDRLGPNWAKFRSSVWRARLGAFVCGALAVPAFAPFGFWPLGLLSLLGLLALLQEQTPRRALGLGFAWGLGLNLPGLWWIHVSMTQFGGINLPMAVVLVGVLCLYLSLFPALACGLLARFWPTTDWRRHLVGLPLLWLLADWGLGHLLTGFPWLWLGYSQIDTPLAGFAPLLGVQGVTLALLLCASGLLLAAQQRRWPWLLLPLGLFGLGALLKPIAWTQDGKPLKFALMQGNIPQAMKWDPAMVRPTLLRYMDMSRLNQDADVIIWPESAVPALENEVPEFLVNVDKAMRFNNTGFITGIQVMEPDTERFYNALLGLGQMDQDELEEYHFGHANRYYKHHLLPIGEFVPFGDLLRPLAPFFNLPMSSFSRGDEVQPNLLVQGHHFAPAICYEIAFSDELRRNVNADTHYLVTVSNDTWFGTSIGPWQHMSIARMRALELGKPVLRATNSGVTVAIDAKGEVMKTLPQFEEGVLRATVAPAQGQTPYNRLGSAPLLLLLALGWLLGRWRRPVEAD